MLSLQIGNDVALPLIRNHALQKPPSNNHTLQLVTVISRRRRKNTDNQTECEWKKKKEATSKCIANQDVIRIKN